MRFGICIQYVKGKARVSSCCQIQLKQDQSFLPSINNSFKIKHGILFAKKLSWKSDFFAKMYYDKVPQIISTLVIPAYKHLFNYTPCLSFFLIQIKTKTTKNFN